VLYICGTDEHGAPAEIAAYEAGQDVADYVTEQFRIQLAIYERFGLSFDHFGRSSSPDNHELTTRVFLELDENGYIYSQKLKQMYSPADGRFLPDRYIIGTCPNCGYDRARGDQCENCTRLLDPPDLIEPRSALSGSRELEMRETDHLFLRLSTLEPRIRDWVLQRQEAWPALTRQIAMKWLNEGLRDRGITRDLAWGIPVPRPGFENKVFYVWFDAPIAYIAATKEWAKKASRPDDWRGWWLGADDVRYTQFMGKDNLPFHTIMFPGMLLGATSDWKLADQIKGFHWLDYYGGKFSTSSGRGVFTNQALDLYPADYWRYFLMTILPETSDSTFTWELFAETVNKDLADTLGNFVNRVLRFCESKFGTTIPAGGTPGAREDQLWKECQEKVELYRASLRNQEFRAAMRELRALWVLGNTYIHERAPWLAIRTDADDAALSIRTCFNLVRLFAAAAWPVVPGLSGAIHDALQLSADERAVPLAEITIDGLGAGRTFEVVPPLVKRIEQEEVLELRHQFAGSE
ncbi:MAG TPA: methionine--tRNA ligase, partial [Longimicrobium sp.]